MGNELNICSGKSYTVVAYKRAIILYPSLMTPAVLAGNHDNLDLLLIGEEGITPIDIAIQLKIDYQLHNRKRYHRSLLPQDIISINPPDGQPLEKIITTTTKKFKGILDDQVLKSFQDSGYKKLYCVSIKNNGLFTPGKADPNRCCLYNLIWIHYNDETGVPYGSVSCSDDFKMPTDSSPMLNYIGRFPNIVIANELHDHLIQSVLNDLNGNDIPEKGKYTFKFKDNFPVGIDFSEPVQSYHPVFYFNKKKYFNLGHITDLHICARQGVLRKSKVRIIEYYNKDEKEIDKEVSPEIGEKVNISLGNVKEILKKIGEDPKIDILLITGDIIDYIKSLYIKDLDDLLNKYRKDDLSVTEIWDLVDVNDNNDRYQDFVDFIIFYSLIIEFYRKHEKPVFIVSGNHDCYYKPFGISPRLLGKRNEGIPADHNLTIYEAILAFGKSFDAAVPLGTSNNRPGHFEPKKFKWFYSVLTPFSDFSITFPEQSLVGLGWGDDEDLADIDKWGHLGRSNAISDKQLEILEHAINSEKKVVLMSHFTFVSYSDHIPSDKEEGGLVLTNRSGLTDAGEFTVYDNGTFGEHREDLYVKYICPRTDPKLNKKIQLILSGHSHRRGLYTTPGLDWKGGGLAVETKFYDLGQLEKAKNDIKYNEMLGTLIIVSDSLGPLPRYNKWYDKSMKRDFFKGWESDRASGTKVIFDEDGTVKSIEPIPVGPKPRFVVAVDYFDLLTDERIIKEFITPISRMPDLKDERYEKAYYFQVVLNERLSNRNIHVVDIIMYHKNERGWSKVQLALEESLWLIRGESDISVFRNYICNPELQQQNFLAIKYGTEDRDLNNQYDFKDYWNFPFKVEKERSPGIKRYLIIRDKDLAEKPDFGWRGKHLPDKYGLKKI